LYCCALLVFHQPYGSEEKPLVFSLRNRSSVSDAWWQQCIVLNSLLCYRRALINLQSSLLRSRLSLSLFKLARSPLPGLLRHAFFPHPSGLQTEHFQKTTKSHLSCVFELCVTVHWVYVKVSSLSSKCNNILGKNVSWFLQFLLKIKSHISINLNSTQSHPTFFLSLVKALQWVIPCFMLTLWC